MKALFLKLKRPFVLLPVIIAVFILAGSAAVALGYYPIATVNGAWITQREFNLLYGANSQYVEKMKKTYPLATSTNPSVNDMQAQVLDRMVEVSLVSTASHKEVGSDMDKLIAAKLDEYGADQQLFAAAQGIYGFSENEFTKEVLIPQAERDILSGRLFVKGEKFEDAVLDMRRKAKVSIMSGKFEWDGLKVKTK